HDRGPAAVWLRAESHGVGIDAHAHARQPVFSGRGRREFPDLHHHIGDRLRRRLCRHVDALHHHGSYPNMIVRKIDGVWQEWCGVNELLTKMVATRNVIYADGRTEEEACEPYPVEVYVSAANLGPWSDAELAVFGLARPVPFVPL